MPTSDRRPAATPEVALLEQLPHRHRDAVLPEVHCDDGDLWSLRVRTADDPAAAFAAAAEAGWDLDGCADLPADVVAALLEGGSTDVHLMSDERVAVAVRDRAWRRRQGDLPRVHPSDVIGWCGTRTGPPPLLLVEACKQDPALVADAAAGLDGPGRAAVRLLELAGETFSEVTDPSLGADVAAAVVAAVALPLDDDTAVLPRVCALVRLLVDVDLGDQRTNVIARSAEWIPHLHDPGALDVAQRQWLREAVEFADLGRVPERLLQELAAAAGPAPALLREFGARRWPFPASQLLVNDVRQLQALADLAADGTFDAVVASAALAIWVDGPDADRLVAALPAWGAHAFGVGPHAERVVADAYDRDPDLVRSTGAVLPPRAAVRLGRWHDLARASGGVFGTRWSDADLVAVAEAIGAGRTGWQEVPSLVLHALAKSTAARRALLAAPGGPHALASFLGRPDGPVATEILQAAAEHGTVTETVAALRNWDGADLGRVPHDALWSLLLGHELLTSPTVAADVVADLCACVDDDLVPDAVVALLELLHGGFPGTVGEAVAAVALTV